MRTTGSRDELDLESVGGIHLNDRAKVSAPEAVLGKITIENDGFEYVEHFTQVGKAVTKRGES